MSYLSKIFGWKKPENPTNLEMIEKELNCQFPKKLHDFISKNQGKEIILSLPDQKYRILFSITNCDSQRNPYENVVYLSNVLSDYMKPDYNLKARKRRLPFAQNLSGDQKKYLYFVGEEGKEFQEKVYVTDIDSRIEEIEITNAIALFDSTVEMENNFQIVFDCKPKSVEKLFNDFQLPKPICYWKDSFGISPLQYSEEYSNGFSIEQHAVNYRFEDDPSGTIAKFEMQSVFTNEGKRFYTSSAYEIDTPSLEDSINYSVNEYQTYYFRLFSIIDALIKSKESAIEKGFINDKEFINLIGIKQLFHITNQRFKSIETNEI